MCHAGPPSTQAQSRCKAPALPSRSPPPPYPSELTRHPSGLLHPYTPSALPPYIGTGGGMSTYLGQAWWGRELTGLQAQATSLQRILRVHWLNGPPGGGWDGGQTQRPLTPLPHLLEQCPSPHCTLGCHGSCKHVGAQALLPT